MPFEIHYGAWIREAGGGHTLLIRVDESEVKEHLKKVLDGEKVDEAFRHLRAKIVERLRRS